MRIAMLAALVAAIALPAAAREQRSCGDLPGPIEVTAFTVDGDGLAPIGKRWSVRLWGIDAPELRDRHSRLESAPGMQARVWLDEAIAKADYKVRCEPQTWDHYCRVVAVCTAGDADLSEGLLRAGLAYGFGRATSVRDTATVTALRRHYADVERDARKAGAGLWPVWLGH
jgi:endonuclease YncB( thermonuclease family)